MGSEPISESSFTAVVNAPIEKVDLADWLFGRRMPNTSAARLLTSLQAPRDPRMAKRMSINVEMIGGSFVVQHYVEDIAEKHHIRLISLSDTFSPNGHTKVQVIWELSVKPIDGRSCEFTNHVHGDATEDRIAAEPAIVKPAIVVLASRHSRENIVDMMGKGAASAPFP